MMPPKRARFVGLAEFVVCQFELNLLSQGVFTHSIAAYAAWREFSPLFADPRGCFLGHGMGNHMPYSILRFAQEPRAAANTPPVSLDWRILGDYTRFFLNDYLADFTNKKDPEFSRESLIETLSHDHDCTACILTGDGWQWRHVCQILMEQNT